MARSGLCQRTSLSAATLFVVVSLSFLYSSGCGSAPVRFDNELQHVGSLIQQGREGEAKAAIEAVLAKSDNGKNLSPEERLELQILAADKSCYMAMHEEPYFVPADLSTNDELKLTLAREKVAEALKKAREEYRAAERQAAKMDVYGGAIEYRINLGIAHTNLRLAALAEMSGTEDRSGLYGACAQQIRRCESIATQLNSEPLQKNPRLLYVKFWLTHCQQVRRESLERGSMTPAEIAEAFKDTRFQLYKVYAEFIQTQQGDAVQHGAFRDMLHFVYRHRTPKQLEDQRSDIANAYFESLQEYTQGLSGDLDPSWRSFHDELKNYFGAHSRWANEKKSAAEAIAFARQLRDNPDMATSRKELSKGLERLRAVPKDHHDGEYLAIRGAIEDRLMSLYLAWGEEQLASQDFSKASMAANEVYSLGNAGVNAKPEKGQPSEKFAEMELRWQNLSRDAKAGLQYQELVAKVNRSLEANNLKGAQQLLRVAQDNPDLKGDFVKDRIDQLSNSLTESGEVTMELAQLIKKLGSGVGARNPRYDDLVKDALRANSIARENSVAEIFSKPAGELFREVMLGANRFDEIVAAWEGIPSLTPSERIDLAYSYAMNEEYEKAAQEFERIGKLDDAGYRSDDHRLEVLKVAAKSNLKVGNREQGSRLYNAAVRVAEKKDRRSLQSVVKDLNNDYQEILDDDKLGPEDQIVYRSDLNAFAPKLAGFEQEVKDNLKNLFLLLYEAGSAGAVGKYEEAYQRWREFLDSGGSFGELSEAEREVAVMLTGCYANYIPLEDVTVYTYRSENRSQVIHRRVHRAQFGEYKVIVDLGETNVEETWSRSSGSAVAKIDSDLYKGELLVNLDPNDMEARRRSNDNFTCEIVSVGNTVTADRAYDGCLEVHITSNDEDEADADGRFRLVYWLAPEVGIVKFQDPGGTFLLSKLQR